MHKIDRDGLHPTLRRLYDYWSARRVEDRLPGRADIDILDLTDILSALVLFDVERDAGGAHLRFRVCGTDHVALTGRDPTGLRMDECYDPATAADLMAPYLWVMAERRPHLREGRVRLPDRDFVSYARLAVPLAEDGVTVDKILCAFVFLPGR